MNILSNKRLLQTAIISFLFLFIFYGCQKNDSLILRQTKEIEGRFFNDQGISDVRLKAVIEDLKKKNAGFSFVKSLVRKAGYPLWKHTRIDNNSSTQYQQRSQGGTDTIYLYTPFAEDLYRNIQAVLITRIINEDTTYKFVHANDYVNYPVTPPEEGMQTTASDIARLFMFFENSVFSNIEFDITDQAVIFVPQQATTFIKSVSVTNGSNWVKVCRLIWKDPDGESDLTHQSGNEYYHTTECETTYIGNEGSGGGPSITGLYTNNDPDPFDSYPSDDIEQFQAQGPVRTLNGWANLYMPPNNDDWDGFVEAQTIDNKIQNPCLSGTFTLVASSSLNNFITDVLTTTFGETGDFNIEIKDEILNNLLKDAVTTAQPYSNGRIDFLIKLNSEVLPDASKEYTGATIYHEILHAYLRTKGIKGDLIQHNILANEYADKLKDAIINAFPSIDPIDAKALAWGGLHETAAYDSIRTNHPTEFADLQSRNAKHRVSTSGTPC
jgi:hypothetical protein